MIAKTKKQAQLTQIEQKEAVIKKEIAIQNEKNKLNVLLHAANIDGVHSLFEDMIRDDSEFLRLSKLPGFDEKMKKYEVGIIKQRDKYTDAVIAIYNEKSREDEILCKTLKKVAFASESKSIKIINAFQNEELNTLTEQILAITDESKAADIVNEKLKLKSDSLMEAEMECVEQINFIMNAYEDRITDLMKKNLNNAEAYFSEIQSLENDNHQSLLDLIASILEKIKEHGIDAVVEALPENEALRNMIVDKEAINNSITLSHDNHISHIGRLEDLVRDREEKEKKEKMDKLNDEQYKRNRLRISEILIFVEKYKKHFGIHDTETSTAI